MILFEMKAFELESEVLTTKNTKFHERKKACGVEGGVTRPDCKVLAELGLSVPGVKFLGRLKIMMHSKHYDSFTALVAFMED